MDSNTVMARKAVARRATRSQVAGNDAAAQIRLPEVYLHPGQNHVATGPIMLKMILGSCAGVFLYDSALAIGGATHFMLPLHGGGQPSPRYGDVAIAQLMENFRALGSNPRNIHAKVFGGASMLSALRDLNGGHIGQIGHRNVDTAMEILAQASIAVVEKDVLGNRGRKVSMVSDTGEITLEFVSNADGNR